MLLQSSGLDVAHFGGIEEAWHGMCWGEVQITTAQRMTRSSRVGPRASPRKTVNRVKSKEEACGGGYDAFRVGKKFMYATALRFSDWSSQSVFNSRVYWREICSVIC